MKATYIKTHCDLIKLVSYIQFFSAIIKEIKEKKYLNRNMLGKIFAVKSTKKLYRINSKQEA